MQGMHRIAKIAWKAQNSEVAIMAKIAVITEIVVFDENAINATM